MMMGNCGGLGMMLISGLGGLLAVALVFSLIVLTWVTIGHLRRLPAAPQVSR